MLKTPSKKIFSKSCIASFVTLETSELRPSVVISFIIPIFSDASSALFAVVTKKLFYAVHH